MGRIKKNRRKFLKYNVLKVPFCFQVKFAVERREKMRIIVQSRLIHVTACIITTVICCHIAVIVIAMLTKPISYCGEFFLSFYLNSS